MLPKTVYLNYDKMDITPAELVQGEYPDRMHTRPSASTIVGDTSLDDRRYITLRSEFDAMNDILVRFELVENVGFVNDVVFKEQA